METLNISETIERIKNKIVEKGNPEKIILFGSSVREKVSEETDIDLLIVEETDLRSDRRALEIRTMIKPYRCPMDIIVYTPAEFNRYKNISGSFLNTVLEEGKILYERNS